MRRSHAVRWRASAASAVVACAVTLGCSASPPDERRPPSIPATGAGSQPGRDASGIDATVPIPTPDLPARRTEPLSTASALVVALVKTEPPSEEDAEGDAENDVDPVPPARWVFSVAGETIEDPQELTARLAAAAEHHARPVSEGGLGHGWETNARGGRFSRLAVRIDTPTNVPAARLREVFGACNKAGIYRVTLQTLGHSSGLR